MEKWKHLIKTYAYSYTAVLLFSFSLTGLFHDYYQIPATRVAYLFILIITNGLILVVATNIKQNFIYLLAGSVLFCAGFYKVAGKETIEKQVVSYGKWLKALFLEEDITGGYHAYMTLFLVAVITAIAAFLIQRNRFLKRASIFIFTVLPVILVVTHTMVLKLTIVCIAGYAFLGWIEISDLLSEKDRKKRKSQITYLLPVVLSFCIALTALPVREEPINWSVFKQAVERMHESMRRFAKKIEVWKNQDKQEFSLSFAGYSENGKIGGNLLSNTDTLLVIKANRTKMPAAYLSGNIKNVYTKDGWEESYEEPSYIKSDRYTENQLDLWEFMYALYRSGRLEDYKAYFDLREFKITYKDIYTKSLFVPLKTTRITMMPPASLFESKPRGYLFLEAPQKDTAYNVQYMNLNLNSSYLEEMLTEAKEIDYEHISFTLDEVREIRKTFSFLPEKAGRDLGTILAERLSYIKRNYLNLPEELPERVKKLAYHLTETCTSDYEKVKALEQYVSSYNYTTSPKETPKGQDAVDYFLFESLEGYCTYHASALAVLARCIGIPSRYVQGLCVPFGEKADEEVTVVGNMAHAWCECYIEGIGWIPFEATPSYEMCRYQPWVLEGKKQTVVEEEEKEIQDVVKVPSIKVEINIEDSGKKEEYRQTMWIIFGITGITLFFLLCYAVIRITAYDRRYKKEEDEKKYDDTMLFWYHLLKECGIELEEGECFTSFMKRAAKDQDAILMERIYSDYLCYRYDEKMVSRQMLADARMAKKELEEQLSVRNGKVRTFFLLLRIKLFINS